MSQNLKKAIEYAKQRLNTKDELFFVDYRERFDEKVLYEALKKNTHQEQWELLCDNVNEWYYETIQDNAIDEIKYFAKEMPSEIIDPLNFEELDELWEVLETFLIDKEYENYGLDHYVEQLLKNSYHIWISNDFIDPKTNKAVFIQHNVENKEEELELISQALFKMPYSDLKPDQSDSISSLWENAFYGGDLCQIRSVPPHEVFTNKNNNFPTEKASTGKVHVAIIDNLNGSGWDETFEGLNARIDPANYPAKMYCDEVCGLYSLLYRD